MKTIWKRIVSVMLVVSLFLTTTLPAYAAAGEQYICEMRLVYADNYDEAQRILKKTAFKDYKLLKENLNKDTDEVGVWLAYKTTTDIEDAITDVAVMDMNGGYKEGNFQAMVEKSYKDYVAMGDIYREAIDYFAKAYDAGDLFAESAFRQLNFYTIISDGIPKTEIPDFEGERLGDIFREGIDSAELATMFLQGNSYALRNIRSLIAMGVSYNADGKTYLEKVGESATLMNADSAVFDEKDYDALAALVAPSIGTFRDMFRELSVYEDDFDLTDGSFTDEEIKYAEYKAVAEMMRAVDYLDGKTLYDFCLKYTKDENDYSSLYPLVDALNQGQVAMTKVAHYYDVVRYSISDVPRELIEEELAELEKTYGENPFNLYEGMDRSVFYGTFALTNNAYRADAYSEKGYLEEFFNLSNSIRMAVDLAVGGAGGGIFYWAWVRHTKELQAYNDAVGAVKAATAAAKEKAAAAVNAVGAQKFATGSAPLWIKMGDEWFSFYTHEEFLDVIITNSGVSLKSLPANATFIQKYNFVQAKLDAHAIKLDASANKGMSLVTKHIDQARQSVESAQQSAEVATQVTATEISLGTVGLYILGAVMMLYTAFRIGYTVYSYYNPDYDDVPVAMVDLISTTDGDRYIKYDAVYEAEPREKGDYIPGDLNAYEGQYWNALYYTKSYEAGNPLLANAFSVSNSNNKPKSGYTPVHGFGEVVCYNLNRHTFDGNTGIYLSIKQSKNQKSAIADVPEVVGSVFSEGLWLLFSGLGAAMGAGGTVGTQALLKKKRASKSKDE